MPRDWPDPRFPKHRPIRWWELAIAIAVAIAGAVGALVWLLRILGIIHP